MSIAAAHVTFGEMHPRFAENNPLLKNPAEIGGKSVNILPSHSQLPYSY